jgi:hypothetical protein
MEKYCQLEIKNWKIRTYSEIDFHSSNIASFHAVYQETGRKKTVIPIKYRKFDTTYYEKKFGKQ